MGGDYELSIGTAHNLVELRVDQKQWDNYVKLTAVEGQFGDPSTIEPNSAMSISVNWIKRIYSVLKDNFDFIVFVLDATESPGPVRGYYQRVSNHILGIGAPVPQDPEMSASPTFDYCKYYGENVSRLQGIIFISYSDPQFRRTLLHEIAHRWGNYILNTDWYGLHWQFISPNGWLGGFQSYTQDAKAVITINRYFPLSKDLKYSKLELYLMGLVSQYEVPDITIIDRIKWCSSPLESLVSSDHIKVSGRLKTYTIEQIVAGEASNDSQKLGCGSRIPDFRKSQKSFRMLPVIIECGAGGKNIAVLADELNDFCSTKTTDSNYRFYNATNGLASISSRMTDSDLR
jgi:hypothetical protein